MSTAIFGLHNSFGNSTKTNHCHSIDVRTISKEEWNAEQTGPNPTTLSAADELKKFKELLDSGVITQEEFEAKKKQLLGL